nr:MAG TPA: hypothetical protein [Caudoviricetes sp.]
MNCPIICYPCMSCFILRYCLLGVFMPPTQNSIFGELLFKQYNHPNLTILHCSVLYCNFIFYSLIDGYTACKTVLR